MSTANFIKFYSEHLSKHPDLKAQIDGAENPKAWATAVIEHGKKAGFEFSEMDVDQVLIASLNEHAKAGELNESQLDGVVGGAGTGGAAVPTIKVAPVRALTNVAPAAKLGNAANTIMCPGLQPQGTAVLPATQAAK